VVFSHNKLVNSIFSHIFSNKRTNSRTYEVVCTDVGVHKYSNGFFAFDIFERSLAKIIFTVGS